MSYIDSVKFSMGRVVITGQQSSFHASFDRVAVEGRSRCTLYFLSAIGSDSVMKGIRAALTGTRTGLAVQVFGANAMTPDGTTREINRERLLMPDAKWKIHHQKMKYGMVHAMFVSRDPDFLINVGEESIWQTLNEPRYTTPILRHWMPYLIRRMIQDKRLRFIYGHRCKCGLLSLKSEDLDAIVSDGVRNGVLKFFESKTA